MTATSTARYEKYRCWTSKVPTPHVLDPSKKGFGPSIGGPLGSLMFSKQSSLLTVSQKNSRRLELSISKNTPPERWGQGSGQCRPKVPGRFALPGARNPRIYSICRFAVNGEIVL